jgi:hypothetical protein
MKSLIKDDKFWRKTGRILKRKKKTERKKGKIGKCGR